MLDAAAGPSRAHRLRLLRPGDDPLWARELQGFRFRAAARPGAACSYAMQDQARGGPEPSPVRRRRQRAARLTAPRNRRNNPLAGRPLALASRGAGPARGDTVRPAVLDSIYPPDPRPMHSANVADALDAFFRYFAGDQ